MEANPAMQPKPLPPTTPSQTDDNTHITRLVNAGLMKRNQLPALRMAMKNFDRTKDVARLPKSQRDVLTQYNSALQRAAFGSTSSVGAIRRNIMNSTEVSDDNIISEEIAGQLDESYQPPQVLVLRRTGIRVFPDGMRVAMYSNERLKVKFTVPYSSSGITDSLPNVTAEEVVLENIEQLAEVKEGEVKKMKVGDEAMDIEHQTAMDVLRLHSKLNDENKKLMQKHIKDPEQFKKIVKLASKTK